MIAVPIDRRPVVGDRIACRNRIDEPMPTEVHGTITGFYKDSDTIAKWKDNDGREHLFIWRFPDSFNQLVCFMEDGL